MQLESHDITGPMPLIDRAHTPSPTAAGAALVSALLGRWSLTRGEIAAYCAQHLDLVSEGVDALLGAARLVYVEVDGEWLVRPAETDHETWVATAADREASRAWFRRNVTLSGPFARASRVVDIARMMRGQNPFGVDIFGWMLPQRPAALGSRTMVSLEGEVFSMPDLDATRVVLESEHDSESDDAPATLDLFSGNDYLGLRVHPRVRAAAMRALRDTGVGSGGSRMLSGTSPEHRALERALARWKGTEDAVVFNSGWHANMAVMTAFAGPETVVFSDALNHASIIDGLRLSGAEVQVFAHNDAADLARRIQAVRDDPARGPRALSRGLVVVEGIYSMDGDVADLGPIVDLAEANGLTVHVDEAHSALVLGAHGKGVCEQAGVAPSRVALQMGTLSKAFGGEGGYVAGRAGVIEALKLSARPFWFSTALPGSSAAGSLAALQVAQAEPERRERLWRNAASLRGALTALGYHLCGSTTWIIPVLIGDEARTALLHHRLREAGILASAIFAPAVPRGQERVRLSISSEHTRPQLERVVEVFEAFAALRA